MTSLAYTCSDTFHKGRNEEASGFLLEGLGCLYRLAPGVLHYPLLGGKAGQGGTKRRKVSLGGDGRAPMVSGSTEASILEASSKYVCAVDGTIPQSMLQLMQV